MTHSPYRRSVDLYKSACYITSFSLIYAVCRAVLGLPPMASFVIALLFISFMGAIEAKYDLSNTESVRVIPPQPEEPPDSRPFGPEDDPVFIASLNNNPEEGK